MIEKKFSLDRSCVKKEKMINKGVFYSHFHQQNHVKEMKLCHRFDPVLSNGGRKTKSLSMNVGGRG